IDLSLRDELCEPQVDPCDFNHCGADSVCYPTDLGASCECSQGFVAEETSTNGSVGVACVPNRDLIGNAIPADPCASMACGANGTCVSVNGQGTCACDAGFVAVAPDGLECIALDTHMQFPVVTSGTSSNQLAEGGSCSTTSGSAGIAWLLAIAAVLVPRRRRR
ncbi:MAG: hypothetical protein KC561_16410, partial [Myxococcales bacterium]|nr:hypothetical protein [Myxococcales bacterium]